MDLTGDRSLGMGPGPIPWVAITAYSDYHELDQEESEDLLYYIRKMDEAYLTYHQKEMESKSGSKKAPISNRRS